MDHDFSNKPAVSSPFHDIINTNLVRGTVCDIVECTRCAFLGGRKSVSTEVGLWSRAGLSNEVVFAVAGLRVISARS